MVIVNKRNTKKVVNSKVGNVCLTLFNIRKGI